MLVSVLAVANEEQNQIYAPNIYSAHYNIVTSMLLNWLVKQYPDNPMVLDILSPYVNVVMLSINDGYIKLPTDYRDILGAPSISAKLDGCMECEGAKDITTEQEFKIANEKGKCKQSPILIVPQSEFAYRTKSRYNFPTYDNPIGYMYGQNRIKICPFDLTKVQLQYVFNESVYSYGYIVQPDDTYIFDPNTTVDSLWGNASFEYLYKGISILYAAYTRDPALTNYSEILKQSGLF